MEQAKKMAKIAYAALEEKQGEDIKIIDISGVSVMADYFIIANGTNEKQIHALVDSVEAVSYTHLDVYKRQSMVCS